MEPKRVRTAPLSAGDRQALVELLEAIPSFAAAERAVAMELVDVALAHPDQGDYRFLLAFAEGRLGGYICYGPTPMTDGTYDLYWLATHPALTRRGIARALVSAMDADLGRAGGRLIRVETSSEDGYGAAIAFYFSVGFVEASRFRDFYRPGEDLITLSRPVGQPGPRRPSSPAWEWPDLADVAFGHRDFGATRAFLLACARAFGSGAVERVLEWCSGPGHNLGAFGEAGGFDCTGVDLSGAMVERARRRHGGHPRMRFLEGDMRAFVLEPPADLAFTLLSSIHQLTSEADLLSHLRTCARSLRPGGLYVIEATHPRDLTADRFHETQWTEQRGQVTVSGRFRMHVADRREDLIPVQLALACREGEESREYRKGTRWRVLDEAGWERVLAQVPALRWVARLGDLNVSIPLGHPAAWRLVLVLRREG